MKLYKIEQNILSSFEDIFFELKGELLSNIDKLESIEREFTGQGAYISFGFKDINIEKLGNLELINERFNSILLISNEFIHDVPVSIKFNENGILDYIELEMGMREMNYPNEYKIIAKNPNVVYDC